MTTSTIRASEIRNCIGEILARVRYGREHILIERRGRPVAAILDIAEYNDLIRLRHQREAQERLRRFQAIRTSAAENDLTEKQAFQLLEENR